MTSMEFGAGSRLGPTLLVNHSADKNIHVLVIYNTTNLNMQAYPTYNMDCPIYNTDCPIYSMDCPSCCTGHGRGADEHGTPNRWNL